MNAPDPLRSLPSVHELAERVVLLAGPIPRNLILALTRRELSRARQIIREGAPPPSETFLLQSITRGLERLQRSSLRPVINATGVILQTNLGRAPLGPWQPLPGYCNLEYDLETGQRGRRDTHLAELLETLLGRPAIAVNNGAAATFLALHELAAGYEVIVSRGELIEIGDGFRIPDILSRSGAILREVGTTNRTRIEDYRAAVTERTRLMLRVHPSNFHITGFTGKPTLRELTALGTECGVPVFEDLGSGNVVDLRNYGVAEPLVTESFAAGINLVSFSGDKLLGGPQAGILAGDAELIRRLRANPMFRALRVDKLIHQILAETLRHLLLEDWETLPALRMIRLSASEVRERAERLFPEFELIAGESLVGGGSTPDQSIPTTLVVAARRNVASGARALRMNDPPVIARTAKDSVLLDLRTVFPAEEELLRSAVLLLAETRR